MSGTTEVKPAGTGDSTAEIQSLLGEIRTGWGAISNLPAEFKTMRETYDLLARDVKEVLRGLASLIGNCFFKCIMAPPGYENAALGGYVNLRQSLRAATARFVSGFVMVLCLGGIARAANPPVILLHYDYMVSTDPANPHSDAPHPETISRMVEAFRRRGITLIIDPQHTELPHFNFIGFGPGGDLCAQLDATILANLGLGGPTTTFEALKAQYFQPHGDVARHYAIFAHAAAASLGGGCTGLTSGLSELPGYDFVVSVGYFFHTPNHFGWSCCNPTFGDCNGIKDYCLRIEAGTAMHELGHNLDLHHGGDEDLNYKPNYISVMNYLYQGGGVVFAASPGSTTFNHWELDYSDRVYPTLDENHLDERVGLGGAPDDTRIAHYGQGLCGPFNEVLSMPAAAGPVDWNCDGTIEPDVANNLLEPFYLNVPPPQLLHGFDDWAHVQQYLNTPEYRTGQGRRGPPVE
jgi:hypothetical protein